MDRLAVYLDQNAWIALARAYWGKDSAPQLKIACDKVIAASDTGTAIFPISLVTVAETKKRMDVGSKERLVEFMLMVCKGWTVCPYYSISEIEMRNAVRKRVGLPQVELESHIFGIGVPTLMGRGKPTIPGLNIDKPQYDAIIQKICSPETLKKFLLDEDSVYKRKMKEERIEDKLHVMRSEAIRKRDLAKIPDSNLRKRVHLGRNMIAMTSETICRFAREINIPKEKIFPIEGNKENIKKYLLSLFRDCKTTYVFQVLLDCRDQHRDRKIQGNDSRDLGALAIAIPYCNIVVTEKFWTSIAKQAKLDVDYGTTILSSPAELVDYL